MGNLVEIDIRADDLTGPAFASVLARLAALRAAIKDVGGINITTAGIDSQLSVLKTKLQQHQIADLLDINMNPGQISTQLMLLKRKINDAKISDLLDFNINQSGLQAQLHKISSLSETIPVGFKLGAMPRLPVVGITEPVNAAARITGAGPPPAAGLAWTSLAAAEAQVGAAARGASPGVAALGAATALASNQAYRGFGVWGLLRKDVQLFGGALTALGVPMATATGMHILVDSAIELAAVLVPAAVAFTAFGVAAIPTVMDLYTQMKAVYTTSTALGQNIYPLTGGFKKMADAVQPEVYQLFGQALVVMGHDSGLLTTIAVEAGKALDTLGARAAVALTSGGFGKFLSEGPKDLAIIGDIIANIFGTIGNLLRVMPGYANILLGALDAVTKGFEAFTGGGIGAWATGVFLAFHGAVLWLGLATTGALLLGNALVSLAAKFGLATAGASAFDVAQFAGGIQTMIGGVVLLGTEMVTLGAGEDIAAAGALTLEGAWAAITAVNPVMWAALAVGALVGLVYWLSKSTSATSQYNDAINKSIQSAPVSQVSVDLARSMAGTTGLLNSAQAKLNATQEYATAVNMHTGTQTRYTTQAYSDQLAVVQGYRGELHTLQGYQANYNDVLRAAGGNTSFLTGTSISLNDAITKGGQTLAEYKVEVLANVDAQKALDLGEGQAAAARNAQTNDLMTNVIPAMQKLTSAEDAVISTITGGRTALDTFQQGVATLATNFNTATNSGQSVSFTLDHIKDKVSLAGAAIGGTTQASYALNQAFYTEIGNAQQLSDKLRAQGISQGDLTKAIATSAGQLVGFAGSNREARSVLVDYINNALGPGTVSLQSLNSWVKSNSTTLSGFNGIVAASTVKAGTLTSTLSGLTTTMFNQDLLLSNHVNVDMRAFTDAIANNTLHTSQGQGARARLITDLENSGFSARDAKNYVNGLQNQIDSMHGKTVQVGVHGSGTGGVNIVPTPSGLPTGNARFFSLAGGGRIPGFGGGDVHPALLEGGETVVDKDRSKKLALAFKAVGVPGYGAGGLVGTTNAGGIPGLGDWSAAVSGNIAQAIELNFTKALVAKDQAALNAQASKMAALEANHVPWMTTMGVMQWDSIVKQVLAMEGLGSYLASQVEYQIMTESGGNPNAQNNTDINAQRGDPSRGLLQTIGSTFRAYHWPGTSNNIFDPLANIAAAVNYARHVYGPTLMRGGMGLGSGHGYDNGGWLQPGWNPPMYNGTGAPEHLIPEGRGANICLELTPGGSAFDEFLLKWMQKHVRVKGGGSVQKTFGTA